MYPIEAIDWRNKLEVWFNRKEKKRRRVVKLSFKKNFEKLKIVKNIKKQIE